MTKSYFDGDIETARKLQLDMKPLIDALFADVNPIPVKMALSMMGKCLPVYRLPLCPPSEAVTERIRREMTAYGLI
jgi:4-hydroxy-tetrahydrodipicolinate synthase